MNKMNYTKMKSTLKLLTLSCIILFSGCQSVSMAPQRPPAVPIVQEVDRGHIDNSDIPLMPPSLTNEWLFINTITNINN